MTATPEWLTVARRASPLILSFPHVGTEIPQSIEARLVSPELARKDTDWWVDRLYGFAADLQATTIRTAVSRTVIDVNRDPSGHSLYPGQATTGLCPTETFDAEPLYLPGEEPTADEIAVRRAIWFDPYHAALRREIEAAKAAHGWCVLYDGHSIRSEVPRLFPGRLPTFNIGTDGGRSCAPEITEIALEFAASSPYQAVANGRFRGGYITRQYGDPAHHVHAVQMELTQADYLREERPPWIYNDAKAARLAPWLRDIVQAIVDTAREIETPGAA